MFDDKDTEFLSHLAYRKLMASQFQAAYLIYLSLSKIQPDNFAHYSAQVYCLLMNKNYALAQNILQDCERLAANPNDWAIYELMLNRLQFQIQQQG
jgi:predicted membrane chloride channel (bestrophin family)